MWTNNNAYPNYNEFYDNEDKHFHEMQTLRKTNH